MRWTRTSLGAPAVAGRLRACTGAVAATVAATVATCQAQLQLQLQLPVASQSQLTGESCTVTVTVTVTDCDCGDAPWFTSMPAAPQRDDGSRCLMLHA